jgi:hypothetical protein
LAVILKGWDGQFSVLMRKRMARHIDACDTCEQDQRQQVNPVALLGSTAVFIPAPAALRRQTLDRVQLTSASSSMAEASDPSARSSSAEIAGPSAGSRLAGKRRMALVVGIPLLCLGLTIPLFPRQEDPVSRVVDTGTDSSEGPRSVVPAAIKGAPTPARQKPVPTGDTVQPSVPPSQAKATPIANPPSAGTGSNTADSAPAPATVLPNPGPNVAPLYPQLITGPSANSDPKVTTPDDQVDTDTDTDTTGGTTGGTTDGTTPGTTTGGTKPGGTTGGGTTTGGTTGGGTTSGGTTGGGTTSGGTKPGSTSTSK